MSINKPVYINPLQGGGGTTLPTYVSGQYLTNDGTNLSWAAVDTTAFVNKSGAVALTGNWTGNAYQISRLVPVLALTDGATQAISAAQCQNYVIHNGSCTQNIHIDLPAAAIGMQITVYVAAAFTVTLDPNLTDQIMVYTSTAGDYLASDAVVGTCISLVCLIANKWHVAGAPGSWTEE